MIALETDFVHVLLGAPRGVFARLALLSGPPNGVNASAVAPAMFEAWGQDDKIKPHVFWFELWVEQGLLPKVELMVRCAQTLEEAGSPATTLLWSREELEFGADYAAMTYPGWLDDRAIRAAKSDFSRPVPTAEADREVLMDKLIDAFGMNPCASGWQRDDLNRWVKPAAGSTP